MHISKEIGEIATLGNSCDPKELSEFAEKFLTELGACAVGVCTKETLAGGPPSTDLDYLLPGAKSAVSFAVPMDQEKIVAFKEMQN